MLEVIFDGKIGDNFVVKISTKNLSLPAIFVYQCFLLIWLVNVRKEWTVYDH